MVVLAINLQIYITGHTILVETNSSEDKGLQQRMNQQEDMKQKETAKKEEAKIKYQRPMGRERSKAKSRQSS